jgi:hypothetical protein
MTDFFMQWQDAAHTTAGLFWMAFWAFGLGYLISAMIQVFVTKERMRESMGATESKSVALGAFFGFISSSCSFAALSTTRALFSKGAGLIPSLAFLLASTNLVIELGIVIAVFLSWQFVVGEYVGGILLILFVWLIVKLTGSEKLEDKARERAQRIDSQTNESEDKAQLDWKKKLVSKESWQQISQQYVMEWKMVLKDVTIGFTVAGIIATFIPTSFFQSLFVGAGQDSNSFLEVLLQTLVGPIAAFFTFIGSMGNIPLAAVLFGQGVSFAGVMAFIFSDLVVFPVLRIQAQYYGWKFALFITAVFLAALVGVSLIMHYGLLSLDLLPKSTDFQQLADRTFFEINYTTFLNAFFILVSSLFCFWFLRSHSRQKTNRSLSDYLFLGLTLLAIGWLVIGLILLPLLNAGA